MRIHVTLFVVCCSVALTFGQSQPRASQALAQIIADDELAIMRLAPEAGTLNGNYGFDREWTDYSAAGRAARSAHARRVLKALGEIDARELDGVDALNYELLRRAYEFNVEGDRFPGHLLVLDHMHGNHLMVPRVLAAMPTRQESDYENVLSRLDALPRVVEQWQALLEEGLTKGITPPQPAMTVLPGQVIAQVNAADPLASPLLAPLRRMPETIPADRQKVIRERALETFATRIRPAYERLHTFLVERYIPRARLTTAWSDLPDGRAWYEHEVRRQTTSKRTPEEIHAAGLKKVAAINEDFRALMKQMGVAGSVQDLRAHVDRLQPAATSIDDLLREYRDIAKRIDPLLPKYFSVLPRLPFGIDVSPEFRGRVANAYYERPSRDGSRAGMFFIPRALEDNPRWRMTRLVLHEAMPGHHLEMALANELPELPLFRMRGVAAYREGWASYAETVIGRDMGIYNRPEERYTMLNEQMISAVGNVNDTGLHAMGWSRERAIEFRQQNMGTPQAANEISTDRYLVMPAQILSYAAGADVISGLRQEISRQLGDRFDVREFHRVILRDGPLPLDVLEQRVRAYFRETR